MTSLKETLKKKVLFWLKNREQAHKYKISLPNGMLLYGPPGCGKTFFAEKFAEEAGFNFMMVKASDIASTYVHGTQEKIAALFASAQKMQPSILCFDEFDAVVPERTDMMQQTSGEVNEFLSQMNNCGQRGIFVIATSNRPDKIDPAILRTGRIDKLVYIPMPDEEARLEMFKLHLKDRPTLEIDLQKFAKETEGYIASDIAYIVNDAAMNAGIQNIPINESLIEASLKQTPPSVRPDVVKQYERVRDVLQGTGINRRIPKSDLLQNNTHGKFKLQYFYFCISKHHPRNNPLPLFMRIIRRITNIMSYTIFAAIEYIVCSTSNIDGIDETVFAEGIGKVPKGFLVAGGVETEFVIISSL